MLVRFEPDARVTLMTLAGIKCDLEDALGREIDLVEDHKDLQSRFRLTVKRDLIVSRERKGEPFRIEASLTHMIKSIDAVGQYLEGLTVVSLAEDERAVLSVRAAFITLGRSCSQLPHTYRDGHPDIHWAKFRHFRSFMIRVPDRIDVESLWNTAKNDLPPLRDQLVVLLDEQRRS